MIQSSESISNYWSSDYRIKLFEHFDNHDFNLQSVSFLVSSEVPLNSITLNFKTKLTSYRYIMTEYFFSCYVLAVLAMTTVASTALLCYI